MGPTFQRKPRQLTCVEGHSTRRQLQQSSAEAVCRAPGDSSHQLKRCAGHLATAAAVIIEAVCRAPGEQRSPSRPQRRSARHGLRFAAAPAHRDGANIFSQIHGFGTFQTAWQRLKAQQWLGHCCRSRTETGCLHSASAPAQTRLPSHDLLLLCSAVAM